jgi:hypothetical protein
MRTTALGITILCAACLFILGCNAESDDDDDYYDEMTSKYDTYTVAGLWEAMDADADVSGTYILLKDEVYEIQDRTVTLISPDNDKVIDCVFEDGIELTSLSEGDVITIGGVCYFMDSSSYPELDSCDYWYVNSRG